ncbi:MAG: hypothetical protein J0L93_02870 [Deltaproteobacteria bacterium]|nr:hypothetical protein [Deltaproteobacteria bacterium]
MKNANKSKIKILLPLLGITLAAVAATFVWNSSVQAEETTSEKIQDKAEETNKNLKQTGRKVKKTVRDATGNSSVKEDLKDEGRNVKDEVKHQGKKIKRKVD